MLLSLLVVPLVADAEPTTLEIDCAAEGEPLRSPCDLDCIAGLPVSEPMLRMIAEELRPETAGIANIAEHYYNKPLERLDRLYIEPLLALGALPWMKMHNTPAQLTDARRPGAAITDLDAWEELCYELTHHYNVERGLGIRYWSSSMEPGEFFDGTIEQYCRMYERMVRGVRRADPTALVGGPGQGHDAEWTHVRALLDFCDDNDVPLDFISWHRYDVDPQVYADDVAMIRDEIAKHPSLGDLELVIDEWNISRGRYMSRFPAGHEAHFALYQAVATAAVMHALVNADVDLALFHTPASSFGYVYSAIAADGTVKPVYNILRMFAALGDERLPVTAPGDTGVRCLASREGDVVSLLVYYYHPDIAPGVTSGAKAIRLSLTGVPFDGAAGCGVYLLDGEHSNRYTQPPDAGAMPDRLQQVRSWQEQQDGRLNIDIALKPLSVALVRVGPEPLTPLPSADHHARIAREPRLPAWRVSDERMELDCEPAEYSGLPGLRIAPSQPAATGTSSEADCGAAINALWDEDNLYLWVRVVDRGHDAADAEGNHPDSVELRFAPSPGLEPSLAVELRPGDHSEAPVPVEAISRISRVGGYDFELRIPWSALGMNAPQESDELAFSVAVNDSDDDGATLKQRVSWGENADGTASGKLGLRGTIYQWP
jgi:hypothetical protein